MANANLGDLVTTTLRNRRGQLADNILNHNAVLRFLNRAGNVDPADGGRSLVEELEYAENQTFKYYSGYEALDISPSEVFDSAEYEWKQAAVVVSVSGAEERKNAGKEQSLRLVDRRIKNAEKTMMNNLSEGVYSDGTGWFRVGKPMRHPGRGKDKDRTRVRYNEFITVKGIPQDAYGYMINGKPAIAWVMTRQCVKTDKASGIVNDANRYALETMQDPAYPLKLLARVIRVSMETQHIVRQLPEPMWNTEPRPPAWSRES